MNIHQNLKIVNTLLDINFIYESQILSNKYEGFYGNFLIFGTYQIEFYVFAFEVYKFIIGIILFIIFS